MTRARQEPLVSVVIVHYGTPRALDACLRELGDDVEAASQLEVFVVDNPTPEAAATNAEDDLQRVVEAHDAAFAQLALLRNGHNVGFGSACNRGAGQARSPTLLLLNPDARVSAGDALTLAKHLTDHPQAGAAGCRILAADGVSEPTWSDDLGLIVEARRRRSWRRWERRDPTAVARVEDAQSADCTGVPWATAACLAVRRRAFEEIQGFDEGFFLYYEDVDLCRRLRQRGWRIDYRADVVCRHQRGESTSSFAGLDGARRASQKRYYARWRPLWERFAIQLLHWIR